MESLDLLIKIITYSLLAGSLSAILVWSTPWALVWNWVLPRIGDENTREFFRELVTCPVCTGFWIGLIYGSLAIPGSLVILGIAGLTSVWARVAYNILDWLPGSD